MIERIHLLRNFGVFDSVNPPQDTAFTPFTLLYAENGRGKTTLASMLRSLSTGEPALLLLNAIASGRSTRRILLFGHRDAQIIFQNGAWSQTLPDIAIFDDAFVAANVCSGVEVQSTHRKNLHDLILGVSVLIKHIFRPIICLL